MSAFLGALVAMRVLSLPAYNIIARIFWALARRADVTRIFAR